MCPWKWKFGKLLIGNAWYTNQVERTESNLQKIVFSSDR